MGHRDPDDAHAARRGRGDRSCARREQYRRCDRRAGDGADRHRQPGDARRTGRRAAPPRQRCPLCARRAPGRAGRIARDARPVARQRRRRRSRAPLAAFARARRHRFRRRRTRGPARAASRPRRTDRPRRARHPARRMARPRSAVDPQPRLGCGGHGAADDARQRRGRHHDRARRARHPLCDDRDAPPDRRNRPPDHPSVPAPHRDRHRLWHRIGQRRRRRDHAADRLAMVGGHLGARGDRLARTRRMGALAGVAAIGYRARSPDRAADPARRAQEDL